MSIAFAKDAGDELAQPEIAKPMSAHENFVTSRGLKSIVETIAQLEREAVIANTEEDSISLGRINRELNYWQRRKASARLIIPDAVPTKVRFGVTVSLNDEDEVTRTYTIVGEDEANPARGLISWVSPVATALLGHEVGDEVNLQGGIVTIVSLSSRGDATPETSAIAAIPSSI